MIAIPVLCEAENLPRVRLLKSHMERLGINLQLVDTIDPQADRVLLVPRRTHSRLTAVAAAPGTDAIVLYLDHDAESIEGNLEFHIPAWPARSSDEDVRRLARALRTRRSSTANPVATDKPRFDRNNVIALAALAVTVFGIYWLAQMGNSETRDEPEPAAALAKASDPAPPEPLSTASSIPAETLGDGGFAGTRAVMEQQNPQGNHSESAATNSSDPSSALTTSPAPGEQTLIATIAHAPVWPTLVVYVCPGRGYELPVSRQSSKGLGCEPLFDESEHRFR